MEISLSGKTCPVHELENLILLQCKYYIKQSTDSMQSPSKFKRHFFRYRKIHPKIHIKSQGPQGIKQY